MMRDLYTQVIMEHSRSPRNYGELQDPDLSEHLLNPLCGDEITVQANFRDGRVAEAAFTGRGCSISQASASMMTERLVGKSREEAEEEIAWFKRAMTGKEEFPEGYELAALQGVIRYPSRIRCATLAWNAFAQGMEREQ